jgi:ABC-2 type transport system permease protein
VINLIRGELIKVRTTRTALGFATAALLLVLAVVLITILAGDPQGAQEKRDALNVAAALFVPLLLFGIVGATGEFRHRTLAPAVLIQPNRAKLTAARLIAYMLTAAVVGAVMVVVAFVVGLPLLAGQPGSDLESSDLVTVAGGALIVAVLCAAVGVGIGVVVKNQVAGVVGILLWLFIIDPLLPLIDDWLVKTSLIGASATVGGAEADEVSWAGGVLVLGIWAAVWMTAGLLVDRRRDVD